MKRNIVLVVMIVLLITVGTVSFFVPNNDLVFTIDKEEVIEKLIVFDNKKIKPGDYGSFVVQINTHSLESDLAYNGYIVRTNIPTGLKFYYDKEHKYLFNNYSNNVLSGNKNKSKLKIYWYWDPNVDSENDNLFIDTKISVSFGVSAKRLVYGMMKKEFDLGIEQYRSYIRTITFNKDVDLDKCNDSELCFNISYKENQSYPVYAYLIDSEFDYIINDESYNLYNLIIQCSEEIFFPSDSSGLFANMINLVRINFNDSVKGILVTDASSMFLNCLSLEKIDLSIFELSSLNMMNNMFKNCKSLKELDFSNIDTSRVTNMDSMFEGCTNITNLNITDLNLINVIDASRMFKDCSSLVNISLFNLDSIVHKDEIFCGCFNLKKIDSNLLQC